MADAARPQGDGIDAAAGDAAGVDISAIDPVVFANMVSTAGDAQLEQILAAARELILDEVFKRMEGHFDPAKAPGNEIVVHWKLSGREDGGHDLYQIVIAGGACAVQRGGPDVPLVTFELAATDFLRLASGNIHGAALYLSGKLKIDGDVAQALEVQTYFRIPEPTLPAGRSA